MNYIYIRLGIAWFLVLLCIGTYAVIRPISLMQNGYLAWYAWGVIIVSSTFTLWGNVYSSYLQGVNQIPLLRRWEILTSIGSTITSVLVLVLGGDLLDFVIAYQGWQVISVIRNRVLSTVVLDGCRRTFSGAKKDSLVLDAVWPSTWRTGIGVLMGFGIIQASGIIYAQIGSASTAATYFLTLRLIQAVSQFSLAPYYSKLPTMAALYAEGKRDELVRLAKQGMSLAYLSFIVGFIGLGIFGGPLLEYIGSNADFPDYSLWSLVGIGYFIERYGAMHINLYSTTNKIINHIANGGAGIIYIITSFLIFPYIGIYALPVALIAGNLGFYAWYSSMHSYKAFDLNFWSFERNTMLIYLVILLLFVFVRMTLFQDCALC